MVIFCHMNQLAAASLFFALSLSGVAVADQPAPNVLIVVADDLGWGDLSSHGNRDFKTPRLDALAESGIRLDKFYVCPTGATTLASLLTGRYHYRTGVVGSHGSEAVMHEEEDTLGELFRENGYNTAWLGAWRHGINWPHTARAQGFETVHPGGADQSEKLTEQAIAFMNSNGNIPFFSVVNYPAPKITNAKDLSSDQRIAKVKKAVLDLDLQIGSLVDWLGKNQKRDNTIFLFLSDNGPDQFGETEGRYNGYFRGGKGSVHEGGVRVPCFISWPGKIAEGKRFTRITSPIDLFPTFVEVCRLETSPRQWPIDGKSLGPVLKSGETPEHWPNRILFTSWTPPGYDIKNASVAVRTDRWVALRDPRWRRDESIVEKRKGWELYDLKTDPFQNHDLGDEYPFLLSELRADFAFWIDQTTDDGIGPIPVQFGHEESPVVEISGGSSKSSWPILVKTEGTYRIEIEFGANREPAEFELVIGKERFSSKLPRTKDEAAPKKIELGKVRMSKDTDKIELNWKTKNRGELSRLRFTKD